MIVAYLCAQCGRWHTRHQNVRQRCEHKKFPQFSFATEAEALAAAEARVQANLKAFDGQGGGSAGNLDPASRKGGKRRITRKGDIFGG